MASKEQELPNIPLAAANGHAHRDTEATTVASHNAREQRRNKRRKWLLYILHSIVHHFPIRGHYGVHAHHNEDQKTEVKHALRDV